MIKYLKYILLFGVLLFASANTFAQIDKTVNNDSINASKLDEYNESLKRFNEQRTIDSVKKAELEAKILALKTTDNLKKEELQKRLDEIKSEEANRFAEKKRRIDSLRLTVKSFPVKGFFNDTLFLIYSKLGSFSAKERAEAVESRLNNLVEILDFQKDSIKISEAETTIDLMFRETIIMSVSESDALWNNTSTEKLAKSYKTIIGNAVMKYQTETSFGTLAKEVGLAFLVLLIVTVVIFYQKKVFNWTAKKIALQEGKLINEFKIKNYTLFDANRQVKFLLLLNNGIKWVVIIFSVYIALPILFGIFPWTKHFTVTLFGYILNPAKKMVMAVLHYLPNLFTIIVIVVVFQYFLKGLHFLKTEIEKGNLNISGFYPDWANPTFQILRVIIYAFMLVVVFPYLPGSDSPIFKGVSVFLGVLFTFGSSGSLSNVIAGLVLTYMRLFKIGDRVKINDVVGDVIEKSLLVTRIRTIKNEIISIPNTTVMNNHTINYSSDAVDKGLIMHTTVTIGYDVPWKDMHQALLNAADRTAFFLKEPKPFVLQTSLDDFYVSYQINAYTKEANKQATIYSNLHANIQDCCNEVGIEILSPHYRAERDGNMTTIPVDYLKKDYKAPSFNIKIEKEDK